ncbi:MAG: hypothetical protein A2288_02245 [Candidatus Moranbacteria bacterium RIFOXYA12_FULL_44_15]|nr:MAG: hypothetical protein A2288_02245 [Candidatus Moranbacteria bacterium RIFOXYA12_FULL_44_15]OGI36423.1 MAG: hypothetical protein A2259_03435 [Candidatus Moranbacteria bacterium RIFOXYA2_FULL_43_15]
MGEGRDFRAEWEKKQRGKAEKELEGDYFTSEFTKLNRLIMGQPFEPILTFSEKYRDRDLEYLENRTEFEDKIKKLDSVVREINQFAEMVEMAEKGSATRKANEENMLIKVEKTYRVAFGEEKGEAEYEKFKISYEGLAKAMGLT